MKNVLIFLGGFVSGVVVLFLFSFLLTRGGGMGKTYFDQPGECMSSNSFEVMQVIDENHALAHEITDGYSFDALLVLLEGEEETAFYDDQVVEVPDGMCARHIGTYKYQTNGKMEKTVPIVSFMR